jgi:hypothetical protein
MAIMRILTTDVPPRPLAARVVTTYIACVVYGGCIPVVSINVVARHFPVSVKSVAVVVVVVGWVRFTTVLRHHGRCPRPRVHCSTCTRCSLRPRSCSPRRPERKPDRLRMCNGARRQVAAAATDDARCRVKPERDRWATCRHARRLRSVGASIIRAGIGRQMLLSLLLLLLLLLRPPPPPPPRADAFTALELSAKLAGIGAETKRCDNALQPTTC